MLYNRLRAPNFLIPKQILKHMPAVLIEFFEIKLEVG